MAANFPEFPTSDLRVFPTVTEHDMEALAILLAAIKIMNDVADEEMQEPPNPAGTPLGFSGSKPVPSKSTDTGMTFEKVAPKVRAFLRLR